MHVVVHSHLLVQCTVMQWNVAFHLEQSQCIPRSNSPCCLQRYLNFSHKFSRKETGDYDRYNFWAPLPILPRCKILYFLPVLFTIMIKPKIPMIPNLVPVGFWYFCVTIESINKEGIPETFVHENNNTLLRNPAAILDFTAGPACLAEFDRF